MASAIHLLVPKAAYSEILECVDRSLPIYEMLVNGIIEKDSNGRERVRIFCDQYREDEILKFIKEFHPHLIFLIDRIVIPDGAAGYKRLLA